MQLKKSSYKIRLFENDDLGEILSMYKGPDGSLISKDHWEWQYIKNPAADGKNPGIVGEDVRTGEIAGFLFSTPWYLRKGDMIIHSTIGSHAFVKQTHRGKGLYNLMINEGLLRYPAIQGELRVIFYNDKTKNASSSPSGILDTSISLNFLNPKKITSYILVNKINRFILPYLHELYKLDLLPEKKTTIRLAEEDIEVVAEIYREWHKTNSYTHTDRNLRYLKWRFQEDPKGVHKVFTIQKNGETLGYFIVNIDQTFGQYPFKTLIITDYIIKRNDPIIFQQGVRKLLNMFSDLDLMIARTFTTPSYQNRLRKMGFYDSLHFPLKLWIKPGSMGVRINNTKLSFLENKDHWYLTHSDCF